MSPAATFLRDIMMPGLLWTERLPGPPIRVDAVQFLLATALTESDLTHRCQVIQSGNPGPARGWWQFEMGGGTKGVLQHKVSRELALRACAAARVEPTPAAAWRALEGHDSLATCFARLLLLTDPHAIPTTEGAAWVCYAERLWRPGKPHRDRFTRSWVAAAQALVEATG